MAPQVLGLCRAVHSPGLGRRPPRNGLTAEGNWTRPLLLFLLQYTELRLEAPRGGVVKPPKVLCLLTGLAVVELFRGGERKVFVGCKGRVVHVAGNSRGR